MKTDKQTAFNIIYELKYGRDPDTGDALPKDSLAIRPNIKNALDVAVSAMFRLDMISHRQWRHDNAQIHWKKDADNMLRALYYDGLPINVIAIKLERSEKAVHERLLLLGESPCDRYNI